MTEWTETEMPGCVQGMLCARFVLPADKKAFGMVPLNYPFT